MKRPLFPFSLLLILPSCTAAQTIGPEEHSPKAGPPASEREPGRPLLRVQAPQKGRPEAKLEFSSPAEAPEDAVEMRAGPVEQDTAPAAEPVPRPLPSGTKVLHVGDSFAGALGLALSRLLEDRGVHSILKHTDSSYLTDWAWDGQLQKYLWKYNPDLVIVTLGANELGIADPQRRIRTIQKITSTIGTRPCLWVGIPLWDGAQNGLMDVIESHASPCFYWDSNELLDLAAMPRISDGIHPTSSAREHWARAVVRWLELHVESQGERPWSLSP